MGAAESVRGGDGSDLLFPSPVSARGHPARGLALSPLHAQLPDVEELLAERGLDISYETIRRWVLKFGTVFARRCGRDARDQARAGTLLMMKARCWMSSFRSGGTKQPR